MLVYYSACIISILIAWFCTHTTRYIYKGKRILTIIFSSFPLFFVAAFRYGVGTDYFNYIRVFNLIKQGVFYKEYIYNLLNVFILNTNLDIQWIFVICAGIFCIFTYSAIYEQSPYPLISIFLLVGMTHYFAFLNIMRQLISAAILLYSLKYIERRNIKAYIFWIIVACGFHFTSIFFLPFYWAYNIKLSPQKAIILSVLVIVFERAIESRIITIISETSLSWYLNSKYDTQVVGYVYILVQIAIDIIAIYGFDNSIRYRTLFSIQFVNTIVSFFSGRIVLIERFRYLFGFPAIILIPMALKNINNKTLKVITIFGVVIAFFIYSYLVTTKGNNGVLPYRSIFGGH